MEYIQEGSDVYRINGSMTQLLGSVNKTETIRIDSTTVADATYQFDFVLGQYVEQSRITRNEQWDDINGVFSLDKYKEFKILQLSALRDAELIAGFASTVTRNGIPLTFSYSVTAQTRFTKQGALLGVNPLEDAIQWLTTNAGFVILTRNEFISVMNSGAEHEITIEFKFLYAQANIINAITKEEVDVIVASW